MTRAHPCAGAAPGSRALLLIKQGYISHAIGAALLVLVVLAQRLPVRAAAK